MENKIVGRPVQNPLLAVIEIPLNSKELVNLAISKEDNAWDKLCEKLKDQGFMDPRGNMHIDYLVIDGARRVFH